MDREQVLLQFFQALSDKDRLYILGQLAVGPRTTVQLASGLDVDSSAIDRHIQVLSKLNLVETLEDGLQSLSSQGLQQLRRRVFKQAVSTGKPRTEREKVLATFFQNGQVTSMPVQHKRKLIVIRELLRDIEPGRVYQEKELNQVIAERYEDFCTVRRYWVDLGYMERQDGYYRLRPEACWPNEGEGLE